MIQAKQTGQEIERAEINVRVAVYPESGEPEIIEVAAANPRSATVKLTRLVMGKTGEVPEGALKEVIENLIHAGYEGVIISIFDGGRTVRISDKGPGISSKSQAMEFGFSGATSEALREIRGVGAGLGIANSEVEKVGGKLTLEDNIGGGSVVTISVVADRERGESEEVPKPAPQRKYPDEVPRINISERQQKVLVTVLECGEVGPSTIADRVEISVSTAYRDLSVLEDHGLVVGDESGKRMISPLGKDYVEAIISTWVK